MELPFQGPSSPMISLVLSDSLGPLLSLWAQSSLCHVLPWFCPHWPSREGTKNEKRQWGVASAFGNNHTIEWRGRFPSLVILTPVDWCCHYYWITEGYKTRREEREGKERRERRGKRERKKKRGRENQSISIFEIIVSFLDARARAKCLQELSCLHPGTHFWCVEFRPWVG